MILPSAQNMTQIAFYAFPTKLHNVWVVFFSNSIDYKTEVPTYPVNTKKQSKVFLDGLLHCSVESIPLLCHKC